VALVAVAVARPRWPVVPGALLALAAWAAWSAVARRRTAPAWARRLAWGAAAFAALAAGAWLPARDGRGTWVDRALTAAAAGAVWRLYAARGEDGAAVA
jgi:hypothetical protein